ncbi:MAG TPA: hypothetical protein VI160_11525 [Gemmatimonadales bacterium]
MVVRKTLPQRLEKGRTTLALYLGGLDPATLFSPDTSVAVVSALLVPATGGDAALRAAVGRTLTFVRGKGDTVQATVLSVAPPQYRLANGLVTFTSPGEPLFPAESSLIRSTPSARVTFEAGRARPSTEIAYVSQGVTWEAVYQAILDGNQASVSGAATITSQSLKADSAMVQLVAGRINRTRVPPAAPEAGRVALQAITVTAAADMAYAGEQAVGETHVYDLPGKISFDIGAPLTTALFPRARADVTQEFVVPGVLPWRGFFGPQPNDPNAVPVEVWYTFKRAHGTAFGDRPLPGGTIQLFQRDSAGRVQLVGEAAFAHTPAGKDLRIQSGDAFDVTAERVQTDYNQEQLPPPRRGMPSRSRVTASYSVTLTNAKSAAVTVDVRETHYGDWQVTASSVPAEKLSSTERRFRVSVPAGGTATLTYTLQVES